MRVFVICLFVLSLGSAWSQEIGECLANPFSKRYVEVPNAESFPRTEVFTCTYKCRSEAGITEIRGTRSVKIQTLAEEARLVVCQGVKLKNNPWGYDFDRVDPFYAFDAFMPEVKKWASENLNREELSQEYERLVKLKAVLEKVAATYSMVSREGFEFFGEAAYRIREIAKGLPEDKTELNQEIELIIAVNGKNPYTSQTAEGIVFGLIKTQAKWLLPF